VENRIDIYDFLKFCLTIIVAYVTTNFFTDELGLQIFLGLVLYKVFEHIALFSILPIILTVNYLKAVFSIESELHKSLTTLEEIKLLCVSKNVDIIVDNFAESIKSNPGLVSKLNDESRSPILAQVILYQVEEYMKNGMDISHTEFQFIDYKIKTHIFRDMVA
jgi:hypothetical protein